MSVPFTDIHVAEIIVHGELAAGGSDVQTCLNVFHFRRTATAVDPVKQNIANAFHTAVTDLLRVLVSSDWSFSSIGVRYIEDAEDLEKLCTNAAWTKVGSVATDRCPDHECVSMLFRTSKRGRNYRGAKRFGGICEANTTKDLIAAADVAAWQALAASILAGFTDSDGNVWVPFVRSTNLSQLKTNPTTLVGADVIEVLVNLNLGTMNSRKVATKR